MNNREKWQDKFPGDFIIAILIFIGLLGVAALIGLLIGKFLK